MQLYSRPFHPDCDGSRHPHSDCDGSRQMPIQGECSPDWQGPVVALPHLLPPRPGPRLPSTPQRTWKYWPRANPSADAIEFRAQMQLTPAKESHFRNTRRPCPFGMYLQRAHEYACSHTGPAACLLELACSLKLSRHNQDFAYRMNDVPATLSIEALSAAWRSLLS